ncbi:Peptidase family M1 [Cnuella takakiae]|uniref:Aminopeptidase N n=1 Tax=Cnuella takakiae TaxID=1302690 RepID=A0A1M4WKW6_9BACT|nr:M1 family metallopeptidase [Cnuella takakiae]OLY91695.1 hypothetical protein BUE76_07130 [Cnuella takakiae]SHE81602.1 Peptidase family M1 [Cnuella takakiae]
MKLLLTLSAVLLASLLQAQVPDVQHYDFQLQLSDQHDSIRGVATIRFQYTDTFSSVRFNLAGLQRGKGMRVNEVRAKDKRIAFSHQQNDLFIDMRGLDRQQPEQEVVIQYAGIPADGLIISRNKYGSRTFFADNWPNRAHHWLPCNDRPDDKASVRFSVTAPAHYQVIANGLQVEETNAGKGLKQTVWQEPTPIPTKVMVIGVAEMAVGLLDSAAGVPVSAWVYPQDREKGFKDFALTKGMLDYFHQYIGPYPFKKLANVQSRTRFGGMENASAIFYEENTPTGKGTHEDRMAHEVAHQWFGDMVSEKSFAHLWISEGFATYCTNLYWEYKYGKAAFEDRLRAERQQVVDFVAHNKTSVVNTTSDLQSLLNANSYEKGGWFLHMLRRKLGDAVFRQVLQAFYKNYAGANADTRDFQKLAEEISRQNLQPFFDQWLYHPGVPRLNITWAHSRGKVQLQLQQTGETIYHFPLELAFVDAKGKQTLHRIQVNKVKERYELPSREKPTVILLDPNVNLLFEGTIRE